MIEWMGNGKYLKVCTLPNINLNAGVHTMELKVTWHQFAKRNSRKSCSLFMLIHYIIFYKPRIECEWEMGSDLKEISVIEKPKGDDEKKWNTVEKPCNSMTLINMIEYFRNFRPFRFNFLRLSLRFQFVLLPLKSRIMFA